jgi:hypothetical protein
VTPAVEDPSLRVPSLPAPAGPPDTLDIGPGGSTDDGPSFHLAGRRGFLAGSPDGADQLWLHPFRVLRSLRVGGAGPAPARVTPVGAERRLDVAGEAVLERMVVARDQPVAFLEWRAGDRPVTIRLTWEVDLALDPAAPRPSGRTLCWSAAAGGMGVGLLPGDGSGASSAPAIRAVFAFDPVPALEVSAGEGGALRVSATVSLSVGAGLRLAVAGGTPDPLRRAIALLGRPGLAARARRGAASRNAAERLAFEGRGPEAEALSRAIRGLDGLGVVLPGAGRSLIGGYHVRAGAFPCVAFRTLDTGLAAEACLATGDPGAASDALEVLARHQDATGRLPRVVAASGAVVPGGPADTAAFLRLVARYLAWTGDLRGTRRAWPAVVRALAAEAGGDALEDTPGGQAALRDLVPAAEALGDRGLADRLRSRLADRAGTDGPDDPAPGDPAPLDSGPGGRARRRPDPGRRPADADADDPGPCPGGAADHAAAVDRVVTDLLGVEPDAARGRLELRPRPGDRRAFGIRNLSMGGAAVSVSYRREDRPGGVRVHGFGLEQERGPVPVTVAMEPELAGARVLRARVDGRAAELDPAPAGGLWRVPVQLVLDHPRRVEVEMEQPDA